MTGDKVIRAARVMGGSSSYLVSYKQAKPYLARHCRSRRPQGTSSPLIQRISMIQLAGVSGGPVWGVP